MIRHWSAQIGCGIRPGLTIRACSFREVIGNIASTGIVAAFGLVLATGAAQAVTVTLTDNLTTDGDTLVYPFTGLPTASTGPGILTIATTRGRAPGIDLNSQNEYFDVDFGGTSLGRFECLTANDGGTLSPGATGGANCQFSFGLTIAAPTLTSAIADGAVTVSLFMGSEVNDFDEGDGIAVTLSYSEASVVPLPASIPLLLAGLDSLALFGRRRRAV